MFPTTKGRESSLSSSQPSSWETVQGRESFTKTAKKINLVSTFEDFCQFEDPAAVNTNYKILGVVEDSWASVYDCQETGGEVREFAWLLTRDPVPSQDVVRNDPNYSPLFYFPSIITQNVQQLDAARAVYTANGIDVSRFIPYPQDESAQCQDAGPPDGITCFGEELPPLPM